MAEHIAAAEHWDSVHTTKDPTTVSWHQDVPATSLRLIGPVHGNGTGIDVGAGASRLADHLLAQGWEHLALLDVSVEGLEVTRHRLGDAAAQVSFVIGDVLDWQSPDTHDLWHDRAVLHFLTDPGDRARYVDLASHAVAIGGRMVIGGFAPDGPTYCSGLPTARRSAEQLAEEFSAGFELQHAEQETHLTPTGVEQAFTWVVLRRC